MQHNQRLLIPLLSVIALVAVGFVLKTAQSVILPLVIAWFLSYVLAPLVNLLARHRVPPGPSAVVVLIFLLGFFYLTGLFVHARVMAFIEEYSKYADQFAQITAAYEQRYTLPDWLSLNEINWRQQIGQRLSTIPGNFVHFTGNLILVLIFLVFMLLGKPYFENKVRCAFPNSEGERVTRVTHSIGHQISRYLSIKLLISAIVGALTWLVLRIMGVDFPITWGVLTFLFNFIPIIGPTAATIPPVLLALVQFYPNCWTAGAVLAALTLVHQVMGGFVEPKVMGENLNLSPVVILLSLVFWGWLWGITGALLAVPVAAIIKIVCENISVLKPISILMGSGKHLADNPD